VKFDRATHRLLESADDAEARRLERGQPISTPSSSAEESARLEGSASDKPSDEGFASKESAAHLDAYQLLPRKEGDLLTTEWRQQRETPGTDASRRAASAANEVATLNRRAPWAWFIAATVGLAVSAVLLGLYLGVRTSVGLLMATVLSAVVFVLLLAMAIALKWSVNRIDWYLQKALDPIELDAMMTQSLYTRESFDTWVISPASIPVKSVRKPLLSGFAPSQRRPEYLERIVREAGLDRWCELGLIDLSAILVGKEVLYVFMGRRIGMSRRAT
jgi:hypothetical protein